MSEQAHEIRGGDYEQAGAASRRLKEQLKRIGAAPDIIRRAMIAAYEAEMNVVIHARRGTMRASLGDGRLDVEVDDEGPGIADIDLAMKEGYSTAGAKARELGFGAGMGLPNIRRNTDRFSIETVIGHGTRLSFTIRLRPVEAGGLGRSSLTTFPGRCIGCFRCLAVCPTRAIRVHAGPLVLGHLCVDCAECVGACPAKALTAGGTTEEVSPASDAVLVVPPVFLAQFASAGPVEALAVLRSLGFAEVCVTRRAEHALRAAVLEWVRSRSSPAISPACPGVVNLVQTRFPSLLEHVAPFMSPLESLREDLRGRRVVVVVLCPGQRTTMEHGGGPARVDAASPAAVARLIQPRLPATAAEPLGGAADESDIPAPGVVRVNGMRHVIHVLELIENGQMAEPVALELFACDQGCFGSPLLSENAFVSRRRWSGAAGRIDPGPRGTAQPRHTPLRPRPGQRLDDNIARAVEKLAQIDRLVKELPGRDCGMCGAPDCAALAEDVVLGRAKRGDCRFLENENRS